MVEHCRFPAYAFWLGTRGASVGERSSHPAGTAGEHAGNQKDQPSDRAAEARIDSAIVLQQRRMFWPAAQAVCLELLLGASGYTDMI